MTSGATRQVSWAELLGHPDVVEGAVMGSAIGIMAFHGGLEAGTLEIARDASAASGASLYFVDQPAELRWHVPSRSVSPDQSPLLGEWLSHVEVAVALHGYGRIGGPRQVLLGGRNRALAGRLAGHLRGHLPGFEMVTDIQAIPVELQGLHRSNPVNRPPLNGVQVELPPLARGTSHLPQDPSWGLGGAPARVVDGLVAFVGELDRS